MEERLLKCNDSAETLPLPLYPVSNKENTYRSINSSNASMRDNDSMTSDLNSNSTCCNNRNKNTTNNSSSYSYISSSNREWIRIPNDLMCGSEAISNNTSEFSTMNNKFTSRANSVNLPNNSSMHNSEFIEKVSTVTTNTNTTNTVVSSENSYSLITPITSSVPTPTMRDWVKRASITRSPTKQPRIGAQYPIMTHPPALVNTCAKQTHDNEKDNSNVQLLENAHPKEINLYKDNNNNSDACAGSKVFSVHDSPTNTKHNSIVNNSNRYHELFVPIHSSDSGNDVMSVKDDVDEEVDYESVRDSLASSFAASLTPYLTPSSARRKLSVSKCLVNITKGENAEINLPLHHQQTEEENVDGIFKSKSCIRSRKDDDSNQDQKSVSTPSLCSSQELYRDTLSARGYFKNTNEGDNNNNMYNAHVDGRSELYVSEATSFSRSSDHEQCLLHESLRCSEASASLSEVETFMQCSVEQMSKELVCKPHEEHEEEHELHYAEMEKEDDNCENKRNTNKELWKQHHKHHQHHHQQHRSQSSLPFALSAPSSPFTSSASFFPSESSSSYSSSSSFSPSSSRLLHHSSHSVSEFIRSNSISRYHSRSSITSLPSSTSVSAAHYICQPATPLVNWQQSQWMEEAMHQPEFLLEKEQHKLHEEQTKKTKEMDALDNTPADPSIPFATLPPKIPTITSPRPCNFASYLKECGSVKRGKVDLSPRPIRVDEEPLTQLRKSCWPSIRYDNFQQHSQEECEKSNTIEDNSKEDNELYGINKAGNKETEKDVLQFHNDHHSYQHIHYRHHRRRNVSPSLARPSGELINDEVNTDNPKNDSINRRNECASKEKSKEELEGSEECQEQGQEKERIDDEPLGRASILSTCSPLEDEPQVDEVHYLLEQMKNEEADSEAITEQKINDQTKRAFTLSQCARDTLQLENNHYNDPTFSANCEECANTNRKIKHYTEEYQEDVNKPVSKFNVKINYLQMASAWDRATSSPPMRDRSLAPAELLAEQALRQHMKQNKSSYNYNVK